MYKPWGQRILFSLFISLPFTSTISKRDSLIIYSPSRLFKLMCCYIFCATQKDKLGNNVAWVSMDYFMMFLCVVASLLKPDSPNSQSQKLSLNNHLLCHTEQRKSHGFEVT